MILKPPTDEEIMALFEQKLFSDNIQMHENIRGLMQIMIEVNRQNVEYLCELAKRIDALELPQ